MAKKQKKVKARKPDKASKATAKLPKEVGGVKISRTLRKDGEKLIALLKHPLVAEMAAAGLMAFAREMRSGKASDGADGQSDSGRPGDEAKTARKNAGRTLGELAQVAAILGTVLATTMTDGGKAK